ncbi:MAG: NAD(P)H-hydrate dehydratase, partial [Longimicrobiales bacterium]|nr:NAD(P)H-hydrate dehydratase [Longimicrobiales bacterium]
LDDDALAAALASAGLLVDGILGTGIRGAPRERQTRIIEAVNRAERPVVALDVPSGADATTGATPGAVVRADVTVSFGAPKVGALLHPARRWVGRHVVIEIGFPPMDDADASAFLVTPRWAHAHLPRRDTDTHKNRVGRVVVVGGGPGMAGAAILAGRAAFRAGAGLVQIVTAPGNREAVHGALPEAIVMGWDDSDALREALAEAGAVVVGPGLGRDDSAARVLKGVADSGDAPMVLDADGLNLVAEGVLDLEAVASRRDVLVTPHPGEMKRLMEGEDEALDAPASSSIEVARWAADRFGCSVLLKGAPSVVAAQMRPVAVDTQSSSDLAVAGMGDTLSGVCGALLAQGLDAPDAGAVGLYLTGRAARRAGRGAGLTPSDVAEAVPGAIRESDMLGAAAEVTAELAHLPFVVFDADAAR